MKSNKLADHLDPDDAKRIRMIAKLFNAQSVIIKNKEPQNDLKMEKKAKGRGNARQRPDR